MTADGGDFMSPCQNSTYGCGVVFKLTPTGQGPWTESVLQSFTGGNDGSFPDSNLLLDRPGTSSALPKAAATTGSALETPLVLATAAVLFSSLRHSRTLYPKNAVRLVRIEGAEMASRGV